MKFILEAINLNRKKHPDKNESYNEEELSENFIPGFCITAYNLNCKVVVLTKIITFMT